MKHVSKNSKKGLQFLHAFEIAKTYNVNTLNKVYNSFSAAKIRAFENCESKRVLEKAISSGYIISYNSMKFTYAFETLEGLRVETDCNSYIIY